MGDAQVPYPQHLCFQEYLPLLWGLVLMATLGPLSLCRLFYAFNYVGKISPPAWLKHRTLGKANKYSRIHSYVMDTKESGQETRLFVTKCYPQ